MVSSAFSQNSLKFIFSSHAETIIHSITRSGGHVNHSEMLPNYDDGDGNQDDDNDNVAT